MLIVVWKLLHFDVLEGIQNRRTCGKVANLTLPYIRVIAGEVLGEGCGLAVVFYSYDSSSTDTISVIQTKPTTRPRRTCLHGTF
ncbi:hypothetical protein CA54_23390 [Symmachiella macrocystis]|uniref:Uncharacterized protein n=1 Tax=Symmachiella macrocystis TaxID=2527985 RepID=A0A5C6BS31_9PLAN|nr:hypothetical protein CA54_23390 [Symmachiella macrocystis]